jgi:hypothetical protein
MDPIWGTDRQKYANSICYRVIRFIHCACHNLATTNYNKFDIRYSSESKTDGTYSSMDSVIYSQIIGPIAVEYRLFPQVLIDYLGIRLAKALIGPY